MSLNWYPTWYDNFKYKSGRFVILKEVKTQKFKKDFHPTSWVYKWPHILGQRGVWSRKGDNQLTSKEVCRIPEITKIVFVFFISLQYGKPYHHPIFPVMPPSRGNTVTGNDINVDVAVNFFFKTKKQAQICQSLFEYCSIILNYSSLLVFGVTKN